MALSGASEYLNVQSGPLQVGGVAGDLQQLRLRFGWASIPEPIGFSGCIQNLTFNGRAYDLATPALARNATASCDGITLPVASGEHPQHRLVYGSPANVLKTPPMR